jgi:surfeit locus 1 family protein
VELRLSDNHLQYALTWFGLALTLVGVYTAAMISRFRR